MRYRKSEFKPNFEENKIKEDNLLGKIEDENISDECNDDTDKFRPQFEPLKDDDIVGPNIKHDKSFTEKILDQRYGKDAFVSGAKQEEYGKTPLWADLYILLVRISFIYPIILIFLKKTRLNWTLLVWLFFLIIQYILVYKYKKPQPFKCTVCGEVVVPNKLMWMSMYNFPFDRMYCHKCCKSRHFIRVKEDDENNWDNPMKRY